MQISSECRCYFYRAFKVMAAISLIVLYFVNSFVGFRYPYKYSMTNYIITWRFGFVPRALAGTLASIFLGDRLYEVRCLYLVILMVSFVFMGWFCILLIENIKNDEWMFILVQILFILSPYAKFFLHESGYFEQNGFLLFIIYLAVDKYVTKYSVKVVMAAILGFIALLFSETNAFFIVPIFLACLFLEAVNQSRVEHEVNFIYLRSRLASIAMAFIPHAIYCILVWFVKVPTELVDKIEAYDAQRATFDRRLDVYTYFSGDRSQAEIFGHSWHLSELPTECVIFPITLIILCALYFYNQKKVWLCVSYVMAECISLFCCYSVTLVCLDKNRIYFNMYMITFLISVFCFRKFVKGKIPKMHEIQSYVLAVFLVNLLMYDFRLKLFDGYEYNTYSQAVKYIIAVFNPLRFFV